MIQLIMLVLAVLLNLVIIIDGIAFDINNKPFELRNLATSTIVLYAAFVNYRNVKKSK